MAKIKKDKLDLDTTIVKLKLYLKNNRNMIIINCTASQSVDFTDFMSENNAAIRNKYDREKMENKFYIFDDILNKKNVMVSIPDIKYMEIPFFNDNGDEYDLQILTLNS